MKHSYYRTPDHAFGQRMLALRTEIGLTQAGLAEILGVSRHAVGGWEVGQSYPKFDHLKHLITLAIAQRAFPAGQEIEEARTLWRASRQKVLFDEQWTQALLSSDAASQSIAVAPQEEDVANQSFAATESWVDWNDASAVPAFDQLSNLDQSIVYWLAILREPTSWQELLAVFRRPQTPPAILDALDRLQRGNLIERGQQPGSFVLDSRVFEYATARLLAEAKEEIVQGRLNRLIKFGFTQAQANNAACTADKKQLLIALLRQLEEFYASQADLEACLLRLLGELRSADQAAQGYGPANLDALLQLLGNTQPIATAAHEPALSPQRRPGYILPQATSFIGRANELDTITGLLHNPNCRLLTLIGPGGMGKTRLALEIALTGAAPFADGAAFISLDSVATAHELITAIREAVGLSGTSLSEPFAALLDELRTRHMLLVFDNFEHLLAEVDILLTLLARAPHMSILVTSRERLNTQAEWLFDVAGLTYPADDTRLPVGSLLTDYSAIQLFVQRASQVQPSLALHESTLHVIARICRQVAGMPLAIELAAASTRSTPLAEIERQICEHLDGFVTTLRDLPPRHRSLRALFDHSWRLLDEHERTMFSRLAAFPSSWTADDAKQVADVTLLELTTLIDKSLVRPIRAAEGVAKDGKVRFTVLEPLRQYALEQLLIRGEAQIIQRACVCYPQALGEIAHANQRHNGHPIHA